MDMDLHYSTTVEMDFILGLFPLKPNILTKVPYSMMKQRVTFPTPLVLRIISIHHVSDWYKATFKLKYIELLSHMN